MATATLIDVDVKPYMVAEISGTVAHERSAARPGGVLEFVPDSPGRWLSVLERCAGQQVQLRVIRQKKRRGPAANAYLWGIVYPDILRGLRELAEAVGELPVFTDEDDLHDAMKWTFLRRVYVLPGAGELEAMPQSRKLSVAEFREFLDKVKRWAAERHIWVREPGEPLWAA
jgi:hypothetical protein